jgi:hypothetical protein
MENYRYYVEHVPLFYQFAATEEPTERPTWIPSFGPTNEPTEQIIPSFSPSLSPSLSPSVVPYTQPQFAEPWQMTIVLSVITSTITTIVLICAGTYCLRVRSRLKTQYLRSIVSSVSTSDSSVSSISEEESSAGFVFSDVYADSRVDGFFESACDNPEALPCKSNRGFQGRLESPA